MLMIFLIQFLYIYNISFEIKKLKNENQRLIKEKEKFITTDNYNLLKNINIEKLRKEYNFNKMLCPKEVVGKNKILAGNYGDGGYVILDDLAQIKIAYSFGISNIISFDEFLAKRGIDVYMYDHTINHLVFENPKFHWKKIGITTESRKNKEMKTLKELLIENGHINEENMILKIDIEDMECEILTEISQDILNKFKYIIIEYHFNKFDNYEIYLEGLKKLKISHQIFHIHCCNCGQIFNSGENPICNVIEVSYIKKEGNIFRKDKSNYPIKGFDYKICPKRQSLDLEINILKFCDYDS